MEQSFSGEEKPKDKLSRGPFFARAWGRSAGRRHCLAKEFRGLTSDLSEKLWVQVPARLLTNNTVEAG